MRIQLLPLLLAAVAFAQDTELTITKVKSTSDARQRLRTQRLEVEKDGSRAATTVREAITDAIPLLPVTPCRILDTRNTLGTFGGPRMQAGTTRTVPVPLSSCGIPPSALAYSLNITVVPQGSLSYLSVFPTGAAQPLVSTLNSFDGQVVSNAAVVPAGTNGSIDVFVTDATDVIIDINGYFGSNLFGARFFPVTPCRVADTRAGSGKTGSFGAPAVTGGTTRSMPLPQSNCGIPADAKAYSLNITVVPQGSLSFLTVFPSGQSQPAVSTLNSFTGRIMANAAIVPAGVNGGVTFFVTNTTDIIVDVNGYFR